ncbi:MAG: Lrp/AsnC ligand binding domain-containing protein [Candidatus Nitrosotenuis sp.]|uniref:Transcriptional regulator n=1 Tax=Candidatus Nitrosotenuis uzonensis TaxID=1407055 RepID=A0A812EWU5_9ARCH|nr:Lrp/AsnC ligand binding domain-containing protein [Candidatus Nitrosotenuis uzonensis]MCA2003636.1 Lrp/AsnC ligand binding domain-containing protein [Candidatus Nitrosotenuis sp.]CAE6497214.1 Transcriptional regulator [Candidatus Nitrosotenuis uzonensis]
MPIAFVIIHCEPDQTYYVIRNLKNLPGVKSADDVFGYYEIVCKVESDTHSELEKIITGKIRKIEHIISTMTLTVVEGQGQTM